jgi:methionyl-tRNA formyltransferase
VTVPSPRIVMMGTGLFAEPTFEALLAHQFSIVGLVTQPDRSVGAVRGSTRQTGRGMKTIAEEHGITVFQPDSINTSEGIAGLQAFQPELLVVAAYGQILSRDVLQIPRLGGVNVHASLLPRYRGAAPIAWAIYHGETVTGVTIIRMSVSLDAGDMLAREEVAIGLDETTGEVEARLAPIGARLAVEVVEKLLQGPVSGLKQDPALVTRAPKMTKEHGLIQWERTACQIRNQIRAMQPWPTAYTHWLRAGQEPLRLILTRAQARPLGTGEQGQPGDILIKPDDLAHLFVVAGGGSVLVVEELQPAGKRRMAAGEFLRGRRPQSGDRLGPLPPGAAEMGTP